MRRLHSCRIVQYSNSMARVDISESRIEDLVDVGTRFKIVVKGYSMLPLLGFGRDTIVLKRVDAKEDISGHIAMFRGDNGRIVVHKVVSVDGDMVTLRGYGNLYQEEQVKRKYIVAVLESVIRESGKELCCTSEQWRRRERRWLSLPLWLRRYILAILRRWCNFRDK